MTNNIGIISDLHDWHSKQIKKELEIKGLRVFLLKFSDVSMKIVNSKKTISFKKKIDLNGLWVRFIKNGTIEEINLRLTILHCFRDIGVYVHNNAEIIEKTVDKARTSFILNQNNILIPKTWVFFSRRDFIKNSSKNLQKKKLISKPIFGSQGKDIEILENKDDVLNHKPIGKIFYIQEFIDDIKKKEFSDIRVLVSKNHVVSAMARISKNPITNVHQGANFKKIKVSNELKKLSIKISKIMKLGYAGLDFKVYKKKYYNLEINSIPAWKSLQTIESKNITKILVKDFLKIIEIDKKLRIKQFQNFS